jgi:protein O-GlcNAc transferase
MLDRQKVEVVVFSTRAAEDDIGRFIAEHCDSFVLLPKTLSAARATVAAAEIDVLVYSDIGMEPFTYFLAFSRLAPVQCVTWGHPTTTGIAAIDYFISGRDLESADPIAAQQHYSEELVRLSSPPTYLYPIQQSTVAARPDLSFLAGANIYACVQLPLKIVPEMDRVFIDILRRDPKAVVVFIDIVPRPTAILRERLTRADAACADRIHFLPRLDQNAFLELLKAAHVILDTIHFSGGISSAEALGVGKAVVTCPHPDLMAGRVTYAYYRQMGMDDCIAVDLDDYVAKAVRLGTDGDYRETIEQKIRERCDRLFRQEGVVREFEAFFEDAVARTDIAAC